MATNQSIQHKNDPIARMAVFVLVGLALWANIVQIGPAKTDAQQIIILQATPTPALPTPAIMIALPTPISVAPAVTPAPIVDAPVSFDAAPVSAPQIDAQNVAPEDNSAYLANVGAQAEHSPRGDVLQATDAPLDALNDPALNGGSVAPAGCPFPIVNGVCANGVRSKDAGDTPFGQKPVADAADPAHAEPAAVAVPPLSAEQAAVLSQRTSATCPAGEVFYPRTGCHAPGSGGAMPGPIGAP
jgi:hypothetical protein